MKYAVSYVRVSSEDQKQHGFSIDQQITNNMNFAIQNGYAIVQTFKDEGRSAKNLERPALQDLLKYCADKKNNVEAVIVWKLDRISRSVGDYTSTLSPFFAKNNIQLLTVADVNGEGLQIEAMRQVSMVFAELERKTGAIRTKEGIRGKVALGQYPYHAPYGYKNITIKGEKYKKMIIDKDNAFFVRQAYNLILQGDSIDTVTAKLYKMGFRNKHGNRIAPTTVEYILHNRAYTGKFEHEGILIEKTDYQPIISEATYFAVQERLNSPNKTRQTHTEFAYNGTMLCSKCGCQMTGEVKRKKKKDGTERRYIYYHCTGNKGGDCKKDSYIREELIDKAVLNMLKHITIPDEVADAVFKGLKEIHKEQGVDMETNKKILRKRIDKIDKSIKEAFESGMHKFSQGLQKSIEEWEIERKKLIIEEQEMLKTTKTFFEQSNQLLEFSRDCHRAFLKGNAEQKRTIVKIVCSNVFYDGENLTIVLHPVFESIVKMNLSNKKLPRLDSNQQPFD